MSLSYESKENRSFADLTRQNWTTWIAHIKDYILALDHEDAADIWQYYIWKPTANDNDDPIDHNFQHAPNASAKKLESEFTTTKHGSLSATSSARLCFNPR